MDRTACTLPQILSSGHIRHVARSCALCMTICDMPVGATVEFGFRSGLLLPELGNVLKHQFLDTSLQLRSIAEGEQGFQPDEQGSQEDRLEQIVQQSRRTTLKLPVANELCYP